MRTQRLQPLDPVCQSCNRPITGYRLHFWGPRKLPMCDRCYGEAKALIGEGEGLPRWLVGLALLVGLVMLMGVCSACGTVPTSPAEGADPRFGYWHTDGAQTLCTEAFCYNVYADVETREDYSCDFHWAAEGDEPGAQWARVTPQEGTCEVTLGANILTVRAEAIVEYPGGAYGEPIAFALYAQDQEWNEVAWDDLRLVRRDD